MNMRWAELFARRTELIAKLGFDKVRTGTSPAGDLVGVGLGRPLTAEPGAVSVGDAKRNLSLVPRMIRRSADKTNTTETAKRDAQADDCLRAAVPRPEMKHDGPAPNA